MQTTVVNHRRRRQLMHFKTPKIQPELEDFDDQEKSENMQLISQKNLKENEETKNGIPVLSSQTENKQSPSKTNTANNGSIEKESQLNSALNGETVTSQVENPMPKPAKLCNGKASSEKTILKVEPIPNGRPANFASANSTPTSRESGYFSCSNSNDISQIQIQVVNDEKLATPAEEVHSSRTSLDKVDEAVLEEEIAKEEVNQKPSPSKSVPTIHSTTSASPNSKPSVQNEPAQNPQSTRKKKSRISGKDINKKLGEVDHLAPFASIAMDASFELSYVDRVILELIETERMYVRALEDILAGYILAIKNTPGLPISPLDAKKLFGNLKDIYAFNRKFLSYLENCEGDPVKVGQQFVNQDASFSVYTDYCTNYPMSVSILTRCMKNHVLAHFFKSQQESMRHTLPLGAYMLKPVQRILKYHLILQEMMKNCDVELENFWIIEQALATMTYIARHINEMKRKHEDAVHIQEVQSLLTNWTGNDLTTYGNIAMEGDLKMQGAKNDRIVFLFDKMILIAKRREDGFLLYKAHIMCSDLILLESVKENPLSFLISPFDSTSLHSNGHSSSKSGKQYILTARYAGEKKLWTQNIKRLILENHHAAIPLQAQESIMNMAATKQETKKGRTLPNMLFKTTLSPSSLDPNGKLRRRSESSSMRKTLPQKLNKKRQETEVQGNSNSETNQEASTHSSTKSRFTLPWINRSNSPKHDSSDVGGTNTSNTEIIQESDKKHEKSESKENDKQEEKTENEPKYIKKKGKQETKRTGKHKESVISKRHKRRKSQPITDTEHLQMNKSSSDTPQDASPTSDIKNEEKKASENGIEDFDSFEDFLNRTANSGRESVGWDVQIVEAVFDRFKREDEETEDKNEEVHSVNDDVMIVENVENTDNKLEKGVEKSEVVLDTNIEHIVSNETLISERVEEETPTENEQEDEIFEVLNSARESLSEKENTDENISINVQPSTPNIEPYIDQTVLTTFSNSVDFLEETEMDESSIQNLKNSKTIEIEDYLNEEEKDEKEIISTNLNRSLSTQSSYNERRKYFEMLKEIREGRYASMAGNNYDADTLIQTGKVKEMIAHHRHFVASHTQAPVRKAPAVRKQSSFHATGTSTTTKSQTDSAATSRQHWTHTQSFRMPQNSITSNNQSSNSFNNQERFAPTSGERHAFDYTSSSNSSSNSSINDFDDLTHRVTCPPTPKYKVSLQPRLFLWRSQFADNNTSRQRSRNNLHSFINLSKTTEVQSAERQSSHQETQDRSNDLIKKSSEKMNEEKSEEHLKKTETDVWEDFETKTKKFESLCRSSSSEKIRPKQPVKRASFNHRNSQTAISAETSAFEAKVAAFEKAVSSSNKSDQSMEICPEEPSTINDCSIKNFSDQNVNDEKILLQDKPGGKVLMAITTSSNNGIHTNIQPNMSQNTRQDKPRFNRCNTSKTNFKKAAPIRQRSFCFSNFRQEEKPSTSIASNVQPIHMEKLTSVCDRSSTISSSSSLTNLNEIPVSTSVRRASSYRTVEPVSSFNSNRSSTISSHLNRHNSASFNDFEEINRFGSTNATIPTSLRRTQSYRSAESTSTGYCNITIANRRSRINRKKNQSAQSCYEENTSVTSSTATTPIASPRSFSRQNSTAATSLLEPPSRLSSENDEKPPIKSEEKASKQITKYKAEISVPVSTDEKSVKSVIKLAKQFDEIAKNSTISNCLTGRNRVNKGRKHFSDLALSSFNESSSCGINYDEVKRKALLKRHETFVSITTKSFRDKSPPRRFSDSCFARSVTTFSTSGRSRLTRSPLSSVNATAPNSSSCLYRPKSNFSRNFTSPNLVGRMTSNASSAAGSKSLASNTVKSADTALDREQDRKRTEAKSKQPPPSDFVARFCKV